MALVCTWIGLRLECGSGRLLCAFCERPGLWWLAM